MHIYVLFLLQSNELKESKAPCLQNNIYCLYVYSV